jgi:protease-4
VLEKVGVQPEVQRIGRYKSAGDQLARRSMSNEVREMLAALLDNIYGNWLDTVSSKHGNLKQICFTFAYLMEMSSFHIFIYIGKKIEETEEFINSGVYQVERLKEEGWITDLLYDDEVQIPSSITKVASKL